MKSSVFVCEDFVTIINEVHSSIRLSIPSIRQQTTQIINALINSFVLK